MAVVNIDSGVGAGAIGALIANRVAKYRRGHP
jgi:NCAIR mutase (PurE)-related protein